MANKGDFSFSIHSIYINYTDYIFPIFLTICWRREKIKLFPFLIHFQHEFVDNVYSVIINGPCGNRDDNESCVGVIFIAHPDSQGMGGSPPWEAHCSSGDGENWNFFSRRKVVYGKCKRICYLSFDYSILRKIHTASDATKIRWNSLIYYE